MDKQQLGNQQQQLYDINRSRHSDTAKETTMWPTIDIVPNWWNPNVMPEEEDKALEEDMKKNGPAGIDTIICSHLNKFKPDAEGKTLVILDGANRWGKAKKLGWEKVKVEIDDSFPDESSARLYTYTKNRERGQLDEFKVAENMAWFNKKLGQTQEQIAKAFRVDRTTVAKRLALLNILPEVREKLEKANVTTVSQLELISTLKPEAQKIATATIVDGAKHRAITVGDVGWAAKQARSEVEVQEKLKALVEKNPKYAKCPHCQGPATTLAQWGGDGSVECKNDHQWNVKTGMHHGSKYEEKDKVLSSSSSAPKKKAEFPNYVRTTHTVDEFFVAACGLMKEVVPKFEVVGDVKIRGMIGGKEAEFSVDHWAGSGVCVITYEANGEELYFTIEPKKYDAEKLKPFKAVITTGKQIKNEKDAKEVETAALRFLDKYGKTKRGSK